MYYHCVFINQGPARTRENCTSHFSRGNSYGSWLGGAGSTEKPSGLVDWRRDPHPHTAGGTEELGGNVPRPQGARSTCLLRSHTRRSWGWGRRKKMGRVTWVLLPSSPQSPPSASLWQKLTRSQLAKEPEKCSLQGVRLNREGQPVDPRMDSDQHRHFPFNPGEVRRVCNASKMTTPAPGCCHSFALSCGPQLLYPFLILPVSVLTFDRWAHFKKLSQVSVWALSLVSSLSFGHLTHSLDSNLDLLMGVPSSLFPFVSSLGNSRPGFLAA